MIFSIITLLLVISDQLSKLAVLKYIKPLGSVKVIENGDFRGFDHLLAGRITGFRSGGWRKHDRNLF